MKTTRACLLLAAAVSALLTNDGTPRAPDVGSQVAVTSTNPLQAARLRKLHLVRPDLINYPLAIDVVC